MKKFFIFLLLSFVPAVLILVLSLSLAEKLVFSVVYFLVALAIINSLDTEQRIAQTRRMHASIGVAIALNVSVFAAPPVIAIIIAGGLLTVGLYGILREDELFGLEFYGKWDDKLMGIVPNTTMLLSALFSGLMIIAHFDEQTVWVPLIALGFIIIASIRQAVFSLWKYNEKALQISTAIVVILIGIISTLIQFNEARVFGILIWVIGLVIGILLILAVIFLYFRAFIKEKKRVKAERIAEQEKQINKEREREILRQSLIERSSELTWEEIYTGFGEIYESLGIQLFLSSPNLEKLPELVTVSNEREQFFWDNNLSHMLLIMERAASKIQDDENLRKILDVCDSIEDVTATKKSKKTTTYVGENELNARLNKIRKEIKS